MGQLLDIVKKHQKATSYVEKQVIEAGSSGADFQYDIDDTNDKSPSAISNRGSAEWCAPCGSPDCGACYDVGEGRKIHQPKPSKEWLEWKARWEAAGRIQ